MENTGSVLMTIITVLISGLVVGVLARWLMPGPDPMGWARTILVGIAGSFLGALVARLFGAVGGESSILGLVLSVAGAMLILLIYRRVGARAGSTGGYSGTPK